MKRIALATLLVFTSAILAPSVASAQVRGPLAIPPIPVVGSGTGAVFVGTFQLHRFANDGDRVVATGILTGMVTTATGSTGVARTVSMPVRVNQPTVPAKPSFAIAAVCDILHLDLGPLDLNVLGLQIDLSRIVLDITAETGAGNLLGNLLCTVTGLLDQPGPLANLLNRILNILN